MKSNEVDCKPFANFREFIMPPIIFAGKSLGGSVGSSSCPGSQWVICPATSRYFPSVLGMGYCETLDLGDITLARRCIQGSLGPYARIVDGASEVVARARQDCSIQSRTISFRTIRRTLHIQCVQCTADGA